MSSNQPQHSIGRSFARYAIPSILAMVASGLYQVIDGMFVGHYVGASGLAGINMVIPTLCIVIGSGLLIGIGGGTLYSQARGSNNQQDGDNIFRTALLLMLLFAVVSALLLQLLNEPMLALQGANPEVREMAQQYLDVLSLGTLATVAAGALPILVRNDDSPNFATGFIAAGALANIVLDYLFLGPLAMGLKGAAIATLLAQLVTCGLCVWYLLSRRSGINLWRGQGSTHGAWRIVTIGSSTMVMFAYFAFIMALHNKMFSQYGSATHIAAFAIVGYVASLYYYVAEGIANGMQPLVSFYFGAGHQRRVIATLKLAMAITIGLGICVTVGVNLSPATLVMLFNGDNSTLLSLAVDGVRLHLLALCLDGFLFVASIYFVALGMAGKAMFVSLGNLLIQVPFLWLLPKYLGVSGIWLSVPLSNVALSLMVLPMLLLSVRKLQQHNASHHHELCQAR